jgi:hypothetical protein
MRSYAAYTMDESDRPTNSGYHTYDTCERERVNNQEAVPVVEYILLVCVR